MPLIVFWMAYCSEVKTLSELTRMTDASGATPPDHSRSRSVSARSLDAAPAVARFGGCSGNCNYGWIIDGQAGGAAEVGNIGRHDSGLADDGNRDALAGEAGRVQGSPTS